MTTRTGHLRLGAFLYPAGHHIAAWRHPEAQADAGVNFRHYVKLAQAAEAAKFDLLFLADGVGTRGDNVEFLSRTAHSYVAQFEPITSQRRQPVSTSLTISPASSRRSTTSAADARVGIW
jgi:alkanesulfonate monooxygenase SsuD/methylene tetrahydromethanopterin reductase-like flavin-dependent oxidoreductase (luciferase family)